MIDTPHSSLVQGIVWNIYYASFMPLDIMYHLDLNPFSSDEQRSSVGELLMAIKYHFYAINT
jgi:hypothetical protein